MTFYREIENRKTKMETLEHYLAHNGSRNSGKFHTVLCYTTQVLGGRKEEKELEENLTI